MSQQTGREERREQSESVSAPQGDSLTINLGCSLGAAGGVLREVGCSRVTSALFLMITEKDFLLVNCPALFELTEKLAPHCRPQHGPVSLDGEKQAAC